MTVGRCGVMVAIVLSVFVASMAWGGLFDDVLKGIASPSDDREEARDHETQDVVDGLGEMLGIEDKDLTILKKGLKAAESFKPIGIETEVAIGRGIAVEAFSRFGGEYENEALIRYVNFVGHTVSEFSDRPDLRYHFSILDSEERNAFAAPGGYIFVTRGLLRSLRNEAELAGVLAHEVAHVTRRHMLETIRRSAILTNVADVTLSAMDEDPAMFANIITHVSDVLFTRGLDKTLEFDADVYGTEYLYRAGYNPQGLRDYLLTLKRQEGETRSVFFSTHPETAERIRKLDALLKRYEDAADFPFLQKRFMNRVQSG